MDGSFFFFFFFIWAVGVLGGTSGVTFGAGGKYLVSKTEQNMLDASSAVFPLLWIMYYD